MPSSWVRTGLIPSVRTGPDGRFRLTGIGRDRVVLVLVEGQSIEQSFAMVLTAADPAYQPLLLPGRRLGRATIGEAPLRSEASLPAAASRVRSSTSTPASPSPGPRSTPGSVGSTTTDAQGRFRIDGTAERPRELPVRRGRRPALHQGRQAGPEPAGSGTDPCRDHPQARELGRGEGEEPGERKPGQSGRPVLPLSRQSACPGMHRRLVPE